MNKLHEQYQEDLDKILEVKGLASLCGKSVLVTGSTGMVGMVLIDALMKYNRTSDAGINLFVTGRDKQRAESRLGEYFSEPLFHFIEQDVRNPFPADLKVDYIIPLASNTHPMAYSKYPVETIEINVNGAFNALEKARECGAVLLYPSSVEIYGNGNDDFTEDYTGKLNLSTSRSCYTESKRVSEALCQSYASEYNVDCRIVRLSRLFGPSMLETDTKASSQFILKALKREDIVLKSKGDQLFSYTYVADAVKAILFVLLNGVSGQAYNVASDDCNVTLACFAKECAAIAGTSLRFELPSEQESRGYSVATRAILSTEKLREAGWSSEYVFSDAIRRTMNIMKS